MEAIRIARRCLFEDIHEGVEPADSNADTDPEYNDEYYDEEVDTGDDENEVVQQHTLRSGHRW